LKKVTTIFFLLFIIILTGCNSVNSNDQKVTEEKAKQIIIDERSRACCGDVEIISVMSKFNKYIIQWEIDPIEEGTDSINKKTGKIKMIKSSRGSCKWK
jgi:hypothetical protein